MLSSSTMAPVDPHQLLEALKPLLTLSGGIKGATEAIRISSLMKDASKLVARCIYCNIIKSTQDQDAINKFVESGGWDILNNWLQDSKELENHPVTIEILKVYQALPVTVDMLKQNNAAKTIKQLGKISDEKVKMLSSTIVESWMKKVREKSSSENDSDKPKKKKESKNNKHKDKDNKEKKDKSQHHSQHHHNSDSVKDGDARLKDNTSSLDSANKNDKNVINDRTNQSKNSDSSSETTSKKRTSTVKSFSGKFRSTGLEDQTLPAIKKKSQDNIPKALPPKRLLHDLRLDEHIDKKPRLSLSVPPPTLPGTSSSISPPEVTHGKIKLIPPKRPPAHEIQDSSGFMDSLTKPVSYGSMKRRKKTAAGKQATPPTTPSTPISPTTAMAHKLPSVPSFYQDTLETTEERQEEKMETDAQSPTGDDTSESGSTTKTGDEEQNSVEMDKAISEGGDVAGSSDSVKNDESNSSENASSEPKGVLTTGATKRKKPRKTVSWAADPHLKQTFYFELDETERENVNRPKNFNEMKKQEAHLDKKAMESAKRLINDNMVESIQWRRPAALDVVGALVERGANSIEKDVQKAREQKVLQAIFFDKSMLPDTPAEPEPEPIEPSQQKIIPLEDETNSGEEFVHTYDNVKPAPMMLHPLPPIQNPKNPQVSPNSLPYDPEFDPNAQIVTANGSFQLPPEVAGVLASFQVPHGPGESPQSMANNTLANVQHILNRLMAGQDSKATELLDKLKQALEPFKNQLPEYLHGYLQPSGPQQPGLVPLGGMPLRPGLLGNAPPGFHPMMQGPPQGPPGPRICFPLPGPNQFGPGDDQWGDGMMGGPQGPMRMPGPGFPMRGPSGPPPMGGPRGPSPRMMRGGRGRGVPPVCRHFLAKKKCRFGNSCGYLHPQPDGPPPS